MKGFSLVELLVALAVCALLSGAIAGILGPARAAFEATPDALELQQRDRAAVDSIAWSLRSGGSVVEPGTASAPFPVALLLDPGADATSFTSLYVLARTGAAHAVLDVDQGGPGAPLIVSATHCPQSGTLCGFVAGTTVAIADRAGGFDVFEIAAINTGARTLTSSVPLDPPYRAGAVIVAVEADRYWLDSDDSRSYTLMRTTAGGAVQPIVEGVAAVSFRGWREDGAALDLVPFTTAEAQDGPWKRGGPEGVYDEDMKRLRRIDITIDLNARSTRAPDRSLNMSIGLRNQP